MDKKIKAEWVKALRSGDYTQATGRLRKRLTNTTVGYCCLGVLAELVEGEDTWSKTADGSFNICGNGGAAYGAKVGLTYHNQEKLMTMNDLRGETFEQIADYIEVNL